MCVHVWLSVSENYTEISYLRESSTVSTIVPIYRNIFIISPRTCVEVIHIISTKPQEDRERRKQERDYIYGLV